jgi:hypothetical protein
MPNCANGTLREESSRRKSDFGVCSDLSNELNSSPPRENLKVRIGNVSFSIIMGFEWSLCQQGPGTLAKVAKSPSQLAKTSNGMAFGTMEADLPDEINYHSYWSKLNTLQCLFVYSGTRRSFQFWWNGLFPCPYFDANRKPDISIQVFHIAGLPTILSFISNVSFVVPNIVESTALASVIGIYPIIISHIQHHHLHTRYVRISRLAVPPLQNRVCAGSFRLDLSTQVRDLLPE